MARPVTTLVVFFIAFNLFAGAMLSTGIAGVLGLNAAVGGDSAVDDQLSDAENFESGTATGDTLFGSNNVLTVQLADLFGVIYPGLDMLHRAGTPAWITGGILGPLFSIAILLDAVSFLRGWGL